MIHFAISHRVENSSHDGSGDDGRILGVYMTSKLVLLAAMLSVSLHREVRIPVPFRGVFSLPELSPPASP